MGLKRKVVCVSTTKPSTSLTPGGGGGSLVLLCPQTGSIQTSLRISGDMSGKSALGVSSLSTFPSVYSKENSTLAFGFGSNSNKKDDTYGFLVTLRAGASPPIMHWKCRLPEPQMTGGIIVSPCGNYIIGGSASGALYVWKSVGGLLLRTVKAHYRSVTIMAWSSCGRFLLSGGADGMVNAFSLISLVNAEKASLNKTVYPYQTWTKHSLSVTALVPLPSGRVTTCSQDGQVVLLEIFSGYVLATFHFPYPILSLASNEGRLFAGSKTGKIHIIDTNEYAIHQTSQLGAHIAGKISAGVSLSHQQQVFGVLDTKAEETTTAFVPSELHGHNHAVTALCAVQESGKSDLLVSGDHQGVIRVWDLRSRNCVRVIQPWSHSSNQTTSDLGHPVTSICVLEESLSTNTNTETGILDGTSSSVGGRGKHFTNIATFISPLQKFIKDDALPLPVPFLHAKHRGYSAMRKSTHRDDRNFDFRVALKRRRINPDFCKRDDAAASSSEEDPSDEVCRLRKELEDARSTIQRWETVNNKLVSRLKQQS